MKNFITLLLASLLLQYSFAQTFALNGSAVNLGGGTYQVTQAANGLVGSAWEINQISLTNPFDITVSMNASAGNVDGADGMTFSIQNHVNGTATLNTVTVGECYGMCGISPSLSVELDTWDNAFYGSGWGIVPDISQDHLAVNVNGDISVPVVPSIRTRPLPFNDNVETNTYYPMRIMWTPATNTLRVDFNGFTNRISYVNNIVASVFGGNPGVYWGVTAGTGGVNNDQRFRITSAAVLPTEAQDFKVIKTNQKVDLYWKMFREQGITNYEIERSKDGISFESVGKVNAKTGEYESQTYTFTDYSPYDGTAFYRFKYNLRDGEAGYSIVREISFDTDVQLIQVAPTLLAQGQTMQLSSVPQQAVVKVYDISGKELLNFTTSDLTTAEVPTQNLNSGVYMLTVTHQKGGVYQRKFVIQ